MSMTATTTGIGFSLLSMGLIFCGIRFFKAFQKMGGLRAGTRVGILLSTMFISNATAVGILAVGDLFFTRSPKILYGFLLTSHFPLTLTAILAVYSLFYILFPSISPWPAVTGVSILGIIIIILTIVTQPMPFLDTSGGIDLNTSHLLSILLAYLIFIHIGAPLPVFMQSFLRAKSREVKIISLIMLLLGVIGIINISVRFLISENVTLNFLRIRVSDIGFTAIGITFISVFLLPPVIIEYLSKVKRVS